MTEGNLSVRVGLCTSRSYKATTSTRSRNIALTAACHGHSDKG